MSKIETLIKFLAESCHYAQQHIAIGEDGKIRKRLDEMDGADFVMGPVSYQVACHIAQYFERENRPTGGVSWDVVLDDLVSSYKPIEIWERILREKFLEYDE